LKMAEKEDALRKDFAALNATNDERLKEVEEYE